MWKYNEKMELLWGIHPIYYYIIIESEKRERLQELNKNNYSFTYKNEGV